MARRPGPGARTAYGNSDAWQRAQSGRVHESLFPYVEKVERYQSTRYDIFAKLAYLYDPYSPAGTDGERELRDAQGIMQENLIASNCDTISGTIASVDIKGRFLTDNATWSMQRKARELDHYAEGMAKLLDADEKHREAFHTGSLKGTGLVKYYVDPFDEAKAEHVQPDDVIVDESASRGGPVRQMTHRMLVPREVLAAQYPDKAREIELAQKGGTRLWQKWAGYRPLREEEIVVLESWYLPIGPKGHKNFVPGRHVICVHGADLVDEPWEESFFPFAVFKWTKRPDGWYGIGGAERIVGHQRKVNKRNLQHDKLIDRWAFPVTYVRFSDANIGVKTTNRLGTIAYYKSDVPVTVMPPSISPESFRDREGTKASAFEEFGQSRMAVSAMKPPGIDSGIAMREYRDQTTQRFAGQEKGFERFKLDGVWLSIWCAKKLAAKGKAPTVSYSSRFGERRIKWSKVDMGDVRLMLEPASRLGRTPAGRTQFVMEMAQAGIISQDSTRRLLMPNAPLDVEAEMSAYIEAAEDIDACIEEVESGKQVVPEAYQNLEMGIWRFQMAYLRAKRAKAPESVLEGLRQWIEIAEYELDLRAMAAQGGAPAGEVPAAAGAPAAAQPEAALASQAMQLRAA